MVRWTPRNILIIGRHIDIVKEFVVQMDPCEIIALDVYIYISIWECLGKP